MTPVTGSVKLVGLIIEESDIEGQGDRDFRVGPTGPDLYIVISFHTG